MLKSNSSPLGLACFLDVETTGLSPYKDEIVELALCLFEFRRDSGEITRVVDQYVGLRDPGKPIPPNVSNIHGIKDEDVRGRRLDDETIRAMVQRAEFMVAHNARFDRDFVCRLYGECSQKPWLCSMSGISWGKKGFRSRALQNLLRDHKIKVDKAHRAEHDVKASLRLLAHEGDNGKTYFGELLDKLSRV